MARRASVHRKTAETDVAVELNLDGRGTHSIQTGLPFFDHMLSQLSRHSLYDLTVKAVGDIHVDAHHTVEDVGITLGECFGTALGDKGGIRRFGFASVPLDEALATVSVDISGRPYLVYAVPQLVGRVGDFPVDLVKDFFRAFTNTGKITLHIQVSCGENLHHIAEAVFKGAARALEAATSLDPRITGVPSTKGTL